MEKPLWYRWARVPLSGIAIIGTGVILFYNIVPTDEEVIKRFSPEVRAQYEKNRELRQKEQEELMRIVQQTAKSDEPIWKTGPIVSPFEKETRGKVTDLVDRNTYFQQKEEQKQQKEIAEAKAQFLENEELFARKKLSWWKVW